ncbi:LPS-assembly protein precursor (organic solvent tolerance protein), putative [Oleispira antarctica RB-8]|uniref:LPS-assembly protein LptD n=1 Tax=Oleispira antarctica RB-8 TaxID=698738 RepID=R4YPD8_OLEAN|nr:LPS-assembly protein precursor (organic solvent tolerance protein), putative [Oleispira antarctica RB-8]
MNKVFSLLIAIFSTFSTPFANANEGSEDYAFRPLSWYPLDELTSAEAEALPEFCSGKYRPVAITPRNNTSILIEADESIADKNGDAVFKGNVEFHQQDKKIISDQATWSQTQRSATFTGNVSIITPELVMSGDSAVINDSAQAEQKNAQVKHSEYSLPNAHMRGTAGTINSQGESFIQLIDSTYTFCEPGHNDWDIKASEINLDRESGIGSAWHTQLRIKEVPIMYLPYYRFPIDDRRMTGFLDPTFTINGEIQASEMSVPFYLNLHPQVDATITPKEILDHGLLWQGQVRHLTSIFGYGELNYSELKNDRSYLQEDGDTPRQDRWLINYQQRGDINENWHHRWVYNEISDNDYINDTKSSLGINRETHMPTRGEIYFDKSSWHFNVLGESYQTVDDTIALADRPYKRLPQLNLNFVPDSFSGLTGSMKSQATQFKRDNDKLTGTSAINGTRLVLDSSVSYTFEWPFAYITPKADYNIRQYQLQDVEQSLIDSGYDENPSVAIPKYSVDAGLFFERELEAFDSGYIQTLEPRIMHLQVPYYDQSDIPNFDSSALTFNASQLFRDYRFNGNDRIGDANHTTLGLTTRFLKDSNGTETFNASIGRIYYHEDRRVQLSSSTVSEVDSRKKSSDIIESTWNPYDQWRLYSMIEYGEAPKVVGEDSEHDILQKQFSIEYNDKLNHMANISLRENTSESIRQLDLGVFWALNDSWALIGSRKKDLWNYDSSDVKPVDPIIEALAGFEYQSCCWRAQVLYQEQSKRLTDDEDSADKTYSWLLRIELKGFASFGANPDDIMNQSIRGYSTRRYFDFESE